jgi:HK97 family phage portal protein
MPWQWPWRRTQDRALWQVGDVPMPPTAAGEPVTTDRALRLSTVWGCVRLLADSVSTLPLRVYRGEDRDPLPTPPLLARPSADFPELADWLWAVMASLLLRGNAWGVITDRSGAGLLPAQVDLVHPDHVSVSQEDGRWVIRIGGQEQDRADLFHVKAFPMPGALVGLSPIAYAREAIGLGLAAEKYGAKFFGDSAIPSGLLTTDQRITSEHASTLKERWRASHGGRRDIAVLGDGAKFQAVTIAPDEAQFIQTQQFNVATICRIFGVAPEQMGGQTAGHEAYTSPEMRGTDFLTFTLRPWLYRVEHAVSTLLPRTQAAKFNAGGFVRATLKDRYEAHESGIRAGWLLRSEVRELEDRPPIPGIDDQEPPQGAIA